MSYFCRLPRTVSAWAQLRGLGWQLHLEQRCSLEWNRLAGLPLNEIKSKEFGRDTDQRNLPGNVAYRMNGVHLYADILNLTHTLHVTEVEGETCRRRTLRFLNLHYRALYHTYPDTPVGNPFSRFAVKLCAPATWSHRP